MLPRTMFSQKQAYNSIADYLESCYLRRQYLKCNVTWNRVLSQANFWYWSIASRTFLWPPGTKHTAPKISRTATLVLIFSVLRLWAMVLIPVGCANTWALPFYRTVTVMSFLCFTLYGLVVHSNCWALHYVTADTQICNFCHTKVTLFNTRIN